MNIIYLLTNLNKSEGKRLYIGSKQECTVEDVDGVPVIVSLKTGKPYYGSSTCRDMKDDMKSGNTFSAEILEVVPNKKNLLDRECHHMVVRKAIGSEEYYNKALAHVGTFNVDQTAPYNKYGESLAEYGKRQSSFNKRNNNAKRYGFNNLGEFCVWIYTKKLAGYNGAEIAEKVGCERHQPFRYIKDYDMAKCILEYDPNDYNLVKEIRKLLGEGVSFYKISELYNLELPTVSMIVGDYEDSKMYLVASRRGMTREELEIQITREILSGKGFFEVAKDINIDETSTKRYFMRCIRRNLDPSRII